MVQVTVNRVGQAGRVFDIATTAELLEKVDKSRHFSPGGTLEDSKGVVLGSSYPLKEGSEFEWFPPAQGPRATGTTYSPPRKLIRIGNDCLGYADFTVSGTGKAIDTRLLLDTSASLELLLTDKDARKLDLKPKEGADISVVGIGGTVIAKYGGEILVEAELVHKDSKEAAKTITGHLRCYFIEGGDATFTPSSAKTHDELHDPMDVGAARCVRLESAPVLPVEPFRDNAIVAGSWGTSLLGWPGLLRLGLEMKLDSESDSVTLQPEMKLEKKYLYQAAAVSAVVL